MAYITYCHDCKNIVSRTEDKQEVCPICKSTKVESKKEPKS